MARRRRAPLSPGVTCPNRRNHAAYDDKVTDVRILNDYEQEGRRKCGRCGREGVRVTQSLDRDTGWPLTAWYYDPHKTPEKSR